jgi:hypothetical protein
MNRLSRCAALIALLAMSVPASAQLVTGRFSTALYAWERQDTAKVGTTIWRAYQNVQLTVAQGDISVHTYLQGAMNASTPTGDLGYVRLFNLYVRWADIFKVADLSVGRQSVFAGVGNGTIDGAQAKVHLFRDKLAITAYGGATVAPELGWARTSLKDNYLVGGQVLARPLSSMRVGLSYMNRHEERDPYWTTRVRDTLFTALPYKIENASDKDQYGSADVSYNCGSRLSLYGRYDYDLNVKQTSRLQFDARYGLTSDLQVTGFFIHRVPRIDYSSIFWVFPLTTVDEIEGGLEYTLCEYVRAYGRFANVSYTDEKSHRWTLGINANYVSFSYAGSDGYAGQLQSFNAQGVYPFFDNTVMPSVGFSLVSYRLSPQESERDLAWALALGSTFRPSKTFSFDVQWQLLHNKVMEKDGRIMVKLNYWFAERLPFFGQEGM